MTRRTDEANPSPYSVRLDDLEYSVHVPVESLVGSQPDPALPHEFPSEDMALGRAPRLHG